MARHNRNERIGKMDRRVSIQKATITRSSTGQEITTWTELTKAWAQKKQGSGKEAIDAGRETDFNQITWRIRYNSAITEKMKVVYDGVEYDIMQIIEIDRRSYLDLKTESRT